MVRILFDEYLFVTKVAHADTAVLLVGPHQQETHLAGLQIGLAVNDALFVPAVAVRLDFVFHKAPHRVAKHLVFFFKYESVHSRYSANLSYAVTCL